MTRKFAAALALLLTIAAAPPAAAEIAEVYFITPEDGAQLDGPVVVRMGLRGMGVAPAGTEKDGTGHHHVLLNRAPWGEDSQDAESARNGLPADDRHKHFGGGQTEVALDLPAGTHTLQLLLGDAYHVPHDPPVVSQVITITVE